MDRYPQSSDGHGSLRHIQILVNGFPDFFTNKIKEHISTVPTLIKQIQLIIGLKAQFFVVDLGKCLPQGRFLE